MFLFRYSNIFSNCSRKLLRIVFGVLCLTCIVQSCSLELSSVQLYSKYKDNHDLPFDLINCSYRQLIRLPNLKSTEYFQITHFDASYNNLTFIGYKAFKHTLLLENINLSHNLIKKVSVGAFSKLPRLKYLDLSYNKILTIEPDTLSRNYDLKVFFISHNPKFNKTSLLFMQHLPNILYVDVFSTFHFQATQPIETTTITITTTEAEPTKTELTTTEADTTELTTTEVKITELTTTEVETTEPITSDAKITEPIETTETKISTSSVMTTENSSVITNLDDYKVKKITVANQNSPYTVKRAQSHGFIIFALITGFLSIVGLVLTIYWIRSNYYHAGILLQNIY